MNRRRAILGISMLCALLGGAFVAHGAAAAGTTAYECKTTGKQTGAAKFNDSHCKNADSNGQYFHVAIPNEVATPIQATNITTGEARSNMLLGFTAGGLAVTIQAKKVSAAASLENDEEGGEMFASGSTAKIIFEEVSVTNRPCEIKGIPGGASKIETLGIQGTTKGHGDAVRFEPVFGVQLAEFELLGASCPAPLKGLYPVFGTVKGTPAGATLNFNHATTTAENTLRVKHFTEGPVVGLEGSIAIKASNGEAPIAATT